MFTIFLLYFDDKYLSLLVASEVMLDSDVQLDDIRLDALELVVAFEQYVEVVEFDAFDAEDIPLSVPFCGKVRNFLAVQLF